MVMKLLVEKKHSTVAGPFSQHIASFPLFSLGPISSAAQIGPQLPARKPSGGPNRVSSRSHGVRDATASHRSAHTVRCRRALSVRPLPRSSSIQKSPIPRENYPSDRSESKEPLPILSRYASSRPPSQPLYLLRPV
jgi:hypothetical protein